MNCGPIVLLAGALGGEGSIDTLAGTMGHGGTDGIGKAARFHSPGSLAIDSAENLYVADERCVPNCPMPARIDTDHII